MPGCAEIYASFFSQINLEKRMQKHHPLQSIREFAPLAFRALPPLMLMMRPQPAPDEEPCRYPRGRFQLGAGGAVGDALAWGFWGRLIPNLSTFVPRLRGTIMLSGCGL
jgi:hypothetical protein